MSARTGTKLVQTQKLRLTQSLTAAMRLLRFDASGLTRYLEEQAAENPAIRLAPADLPPDDWLPRWTGAFRPAGAGMEADLAAGPAPSLTAHVLQAVAAMFPDARTRDRAMALAGALEPSGWLGRPLPVLAVEAGMSLAEAEALLARLQRIEPVGLFARTLRECLELQAREAGWLDPVMEVVLGNLGQVAAGDLAGLARRAGVPEAEVALRLRRLRGFDPKPGTQFDPGAAPVREPDLTVARGGGGWMVALNRGALPAVLVRTDGGGDAAAARAVQRMVRARGGMLLRIAAEVVGRQAAAIGQGPAALVPMGMADVAAACGVHESTVSRAVAGVSMDTPRGTVWLRSMFSAGVGETAAAAIRARLAALVAAESPAAPLSDAALAARLSQAGNGEVARRTVAKYRAMLAIPPAHRRRRG